MVRIKVDADIELKAMEQGDPGRWYSIQWTRTAAISESGCHGSTT